MQPSTTTSSFSDLRKTVEAVATGLHGPDRGAKWHRILAAATELFTAQGFRKTSVDEIARRSHVAKGTVYLYFRNKAGILLHALVEEKRSYFGRMAPLFDPQLDAADRLRLYLRIVVVVATEMPLLSSVLSGDRELVHVLEDELDPDLREQMVEMQRAFVGGLLAEAGEGRGWTDEEVRERASVLLGLLQSTSFFADERGRQGLPIERFAEILADMIVDGVAANTHRTASAGEKA